MGAGGQNQGNQWNWSQNSQPSYANMFSGAANNYGGQFQMQPMAFPQQQQNKFQSPFQQPNYQVTPFSFASQSPSPTMDQNQINAVASAPAPQATQISPPALTTPPSSASAPVSPVIPQSVLNQLPYSYRTGQGNNQYLTVNGNTTNGVLTGLNGQQLGGWKNGVFSGYSS